jgi:hypothetical protein
MRDPIDYDIHGLAGIRLIGASRREVAAVTRQLGPLQSPLSGDPDITVRFVDQLPASSRIRYLGLDDSGFTDDAFLVLRGRHKSRARVKIPFERIGKGCEIVCERGLLQVPLLIPILNLTILGKGALPLHASAFTYRDTGFLATGWSKGGKTEALLAFMSMNASYVGDEWVYLSTDGNRMHGIPEPVRIWDWHLDSLPRYRRVVGGAARTKLRLLKLVVRAFGRLTADGARHGSFATRTMGRLRTFLGKQMHVDVSPYDLFGTEACPLSGVPEKILFVASYDEPGVFVQPIDPQEIADRMVFSLQEEQATFMSYYWKFRFAFPGAVNELIETARARQSTIIRRALAGREAYEVLHPYPVSIPSLGEAIEKRCMRK